MIKSGIVDGFKAIRNRSEMKVLLSKNVEGFDPTMEENFEHELNKTMHLQQDGCYILGMKIISQTKTLRPNGFISDVSKFYLPCGFKLDYTYTAGDVE